MNKQARFFFSWASLSLMTLLCVGTSAAQTNTLYGVGALANPSSRDLDDSAFGFMALNSPTSGQRNTASGARALFANTTGSYNTANGLHTLYLNTTGGMNTASGVNALGMNTTGNKNIGLGYEAGYNLTTGDNNIDIGNSGVAAESKTIRIGKMGTQTMAYFAGIASSPVSGDSVVVSSTGKLGIVMSSARYKHDIQDMGAKSAGLMKLRPVTFQYKNDPAGTEQYGLVAEEVAKLYPELVSYGADGKVETVHYLTLISMLLNELQKQARENQLQAAQIQQLTERSAQQAERIEQQGLQNQRLSAQMAQLKSLVEQAMSTQGGTRTLAAAFNK